MASFDNAAFDTDAFDDDAFDFDAPPPVASTVLLRHRRKVKAAIAWWRAAVNFLISLT